ncbi:MAG: hypothetical protein RL531_1959, partial [Actinomycetota bacterium]
MDRSSPAVVTVRGVPRRRHAESGPHVGEGERGEREVI